MESVVRKLLFEKLASIVGKDKELDRISERYLTTREATRPASQASQVMTQVCIGTFNRVSFAFVFHRIVNGWPIEHRFVTHIIVAEIVMTLNTLCQHVLKFSTTTFGTDLPG